MRWCLRFVIEGRLRIFHPEIHFVITISYLKIIFLFLHDKTGCFSYSDRVKSGHNSCLPEGVLRLWHGNWIFALSGHRLNDYFIQSLCQQSEQQHKGKGYADDVSKQEKDGPEFGGNLRCHTGCTDDNSRLSRRGHSAYGLWQSSEFGGWGSLLMQFYCIYNLTTRGDVDAIKLRMWV